MKLIVNADDFGLTDGGNRAIIECYKNGIVTSTTLMANMPFADQAIQFSKENPGLGVGVHMVLTTGRPLLKTHKTLVDDEGNFKFRSDTIDESIDLDELYQEWDAQIESIMSQIPITHLDSHHHTHLHPLLRTVVEKLAKKHNLPYRSDATIVPTQVKLDGGFYKETVSTDYLLNLFQTNTEDYLDLMTHPAYVDDRIMEISSYNTYRETERQVLQDPKVLQAVKDLGIELVSYNDLTK